MLQNYFKIAFRNLLKRKVYSFINIFGLALGAAICLLIVLFIKHESSVDAWRQDAESVYRMVVKRTYPTRESSYAIIPQSYAKAIKQELPEVTEAVRVFDVFNNGTFQLQYGEEKFEETKVFFADPSFYSVFKSNLLFGLEAEALTQPNSIVLNETTAIKYFGSASVAVGELLKPVGDNVQPLLVTAVYEDWPEQSHFNYNALLSTSGNANFERENYVGFSAYTYLKLNENASPKKIENAMPGIIKKFAKGDIERQFAMSIDKFSGSGNGYLYTLQPLKEIYLNSSLDNEFRANGNVKTLYVFGLVAFFILLIACVNFINLSTARASERAKEVGIRKTFGSERKALISQFMVESALTSMFAMILSIGIFAVLLPVFNNISAKDFKFYAVFSSSSILLLITFTCISGLLAGVYPAFVLSAFKPVDVLRGKFKSAKQTRFLRSGLVVFQFSISVILIICTLIVNRQMDFMTNESLGFNKSHTVILEQTGLLGANTRAFKNELKDINGVSHVSGATAMPGQQNYFGVSWARFENRNESITGRGIIADEDYAKTLSLELTAGRFFSKDFKTDSLAVVINERAVKELGLKDPIGKRLVTPEGFLNAQDGSALIYNVIGVVKDFHYQSLHDQITPLIFTNASRFNNVMNLTAVHVDGKNLETTLLNIEETWKNFVEDKPMTFQFLDETIDNQYTVERTSRKVFTFFSIITIFIACIGLLGLASYTTRQRRQEIGIRKVLGASVSGIITMLSKDFIKLVFLAVLIAIPIAWYAMHVWLQNFTYRMSSSWDLFALASGIALVTAFLTISIQAINAALSNPIKSIRVD